MNTLPRDEVVVPVRTLVRMSDEAELDRPSIVGNYMTDEAQTAVVRLTKMQSGTLRNRNL